MALKILCDNYLQLSYTKNIPVYKLTPKREVLLIPNSVWSKNPQRDFFENRSRLLKIQILSEFFFI